MSDGNLVERWPELLKQLANADANYVPFPSFANWKGRAVDVARWERYGRMLKEQAPLPNQLAMATEVVKRAAAIETGAIEGLYDVDRGLTFTIARQLADWEAALSHKGDAVASLFESQLDAYESIVDFATKAAPIAEAWIRDLHRRMCASWTPVGRRCGALFSWRC